MEKKHYSGSNFIIVNDTTRFIKNLKDRNRKRERNVSTICFQWCSKLSPGLWPLRFSNKWPTWFTCPLLFSVHQFKFDVKDFWSICKLSISLFYLQIQLEFYILTVFGNIIFHKRQNCFCNYPTLIFHF
jgi:hypothetical protein